MTNTNFSVGNIRFTDEGVSITRKFDDGSVVEFNDGKGKLTYEQMRPVLVAFINRRMRKCAKALEQNIATAKTVTPHVISWDGGHFSTGVYREMENFVSYNGEKKYFTASMLQQFVRAYAEDSSYVSESEVDKEVYELWRTCKTDTKSVFKAMTEIMLCCISVESLEKALDII